MTFNQQADAEAGASNDQQQAAPALSAAGNARRKFARAGLGASGVLLTLTSQSGMAAVCTTPSGSLSSGMVTSRRPNAAITCGGVSPGYYKNNPQGWPSELRSDTTMKFKELFPCNGSSNVLGNYTLREVFDATAEVDPHNCGSHVLACYLNILTKRSTVLTELTLKQIWREYQNTGGAKSGYYTPTTGVKWYGGDIVNYLITTFHQ